ncbi:polysaccharide pyruvyl transferase family protein [uncultured Clostridium sp.]|uniref:polysaccharide pyruvyl transferase family protein n=1 Tax=uncultured Clostridium sp. TaxID=59620 RepID=UPI0026182869|nr:polysaccharide pyruvyl transferase family protein [uncultured Clostridium sp.]
MKKILVEAYLAKNFGDDLFLKVLFERYEGTEVSFVVSTYNKEYKKIFEKFTNVEVRLKSKAKKVNYKIGVLRKVEYKHEAKEFDALLLIGGSIFSQEEYWEVQLQRNREKIGMYKKYNKKVFIIGANFGPFCNEKFRVDYENIFKMCDDVCFRDMYSYNLFDEKNIRVASDIVFSMKINQPIKTKNTLGISLIDISYRDKLKEYSNKYKQKIVDIINYNTEKGIDIKLFSFCEFQGDLKFAREIFEDVNMKENVEIINYDGDIDVFMERFSEVENIIGTRFHSIILSKLFDQGIYPIVYSEKTMNILKDIGSEKIFSYVEDIKNIDETKILKVIEDNKSSNLDDIKLKAELQFEKIDNFIKGIC